ncbi:MAG: nodulation protein NfeD [Bryobacteraceae bacterium]|nr:nodulation protein NfeD [Bryobacteraceae bacterium]MDW8379051.1 nodulation protein NfeD [Bryobacterales bacterium]
MRLTWFWFALVCVGSARLDAQPVAVSTPGPIVAIPLESVVHPITVEIVGHGIELAKQRSAAAILVRLNTPGGLGEATRQTIEKLLACPVPVVMFVTPSGGRAASAGFFLLQAGDVAAMAPGTHTGAATPVLLFGQPVEPVLRKKLESDAAAWVRSLAGARGRSAEAAELAVLEAKSFTEQEAFRQKLIDLVVRDESELLAKLDGREITRFDGRKQILRLAGSAVINYPLSLRERVTSALADPNIAFLLVAVGGILLYVEASMPGVMLPGVLGSILMLLGLGALSILPINFTGVALLLLALALFVLEAKFASHGILGAGGAVAMTLGAILLVDGPPELRIRTTTALAVSIPFALITLLLVSLVIRSQAAPPWNFVQETGVAFTDLTPEGKVLLHGEYWDAISRTPVSKGQSVRVLAIEGLRLHVEPLA